MGNMQTLQVITSVAVVAVAFAGIILFVLITHRRVRNEIEKANRLLKQVDQLREQENTNIENTDEQS